MIGHLHYRKPNSITRLKTCPGGHRHLRWFDPRIRSFWSRICRRTDPETFRGELNLTRAAEVFAVSRPTVQGWLAYIERRGLIRIESRGGGRGRGIVYRNTWVEEGERAGRVRAEARAEDARQREERNALLIRRIDETVKHRTTSWTLKGAYSSRGALMRRAREGVNARVTDETAAKALISAIGYGVFKLRISLDRMTRTLNDLLAAPHIAVPRWIRTTSDAHRWARSVIYKLAEYGAGWWEVLDGLRYRRRARNLAGTS